MYFHREKEKEKKKYESKIFFNEFSSIEKEPFETALMITIPLLLCEFSTNLMMSQFHERLMFVQKICNSTANKEVYPTYHIAKILGSTLTRHRFDTFVSDRIDVKLKVFAFFFTNGDELTIIRLTCAAASILLFIAARARLLIWVCRRLFHYLL